jgi:hypothetical protein
MKDPDDKYHSDSSGHSVSDYPSCQACLFVESHPRQVLCRWPFLAMIEAKIVVSCRKFEKQNHPCLNKKLNKSNNQPQVTRCSYPMHMQRIWCMFGTYRVHSWPRSKQELSSKNTKKHNCIHNNENSEWNGNNQILERNDSVLWQLERLHGMLTMRLPTIIHHE